MRKKWFNSFALRMDRIQEYEHIHRICMDIVKASLAVIGIIAIYKLV